MKLASSIFGKILKIEYEPPPVTLNSMLKGFCINNEVTNALRFYYSCIQSGFILNNVGYGTLLNGLCKSESVNHAVDLLKLTPRFGVTPDLMMYNTVLHGLTRDLETVDKRFEMFNVMLENNIGPDVYTYNSLIYGLCLKFKIKEMVLILNTMVSENIHPDEYTFGPIVKALCVRGRVRESGIILTKILKAGYNFSVLMYSYLLDGYFALHQVEKAQNLFDSMPKKGVPHDTRCYNSMMKDFYDHELFVEVIAIFKVMCFKGLYPDVFSCNYLIGSYCQIGK
jgi:pentatricopeptide repeat domain-containing protein 1